jgi:hypothetical protein
MQKNVPYGKGIAGVCFAFAALFTIACILCVVLNAPVLVTLVLILFAMVFYSSGKNLSRKLAKMNLVEIYEDRVCIVMNEKLEEFHYAEIENVVLAYDKGYFSNGIYLIPTEEAMEWRLAQKPGRYIKKFYKKDGAMACIPTFASGVSIEVVYKVLVDSINAYNAAIANDEDDYDEDGDALSELINEVDDVLDAFEEGMDEGERIANKITKIFNR